MTRSLVASTKLLTQRLAASPLGSKKRVLTVPPPAGPSSNAGQQARQPLLLEGGGEQPVCGWVDFAAGVAEIKDFETTRVDHERRYRTPFDVTSGEYRDFLDQLRTTLQELGVRAEVTGDAVAYAPTDPGSLPGSAPVVPTVGPSVWPLVLGGAVVLAGAAVAAALLLR